MVDLLELELQVAVQCGNWEANFGFFARVVCSLNHWDISPDPRCILLRDEMFTLVHSLKVQPLMVEKAFIYVCETGSPGWPGTCYVDQAGFELMESHLPLVPKF